MNGGWKWQAAGYLLTRCADDGSSLSLSLITPLLHEDVIKYSFPIKWYRIRWRPTHATGKRNRFENDVNCGWRPLSRSRDRCKSIQIHIQRLMMHWRSAQNCTRRHFELHARIEPPRTEWREMEWSCIDIVKRENIPKRGAHTYTHITINHRKTNDFSVFFLVVVFFFFFFSSFSSSINASSLAPYRHHHSQRWF